MSDPTVEREAMEWAEKVATAIMAQPIIRPRIAESLRPLLAELASVRAESEGRLKVLHEKADEAKQEWTRAERAEAELARLREEKAESDKAYEIVSEKWDDGRAEYRVVWQIVDRLGLKMGGCPDEQIVGHVKYIQDERDDARAELSSLKAEHEESMLSLRAHADHLKTAMEMREREHEERVKGLEAGAKVAVGHAKKKTHELAEARAEVEQKTRRAERAETEVEMRGEEVERLKVERDKAVESSAHWEVQYNKLHRKRERLQERISLAEKLAKAIALSDCGSMDPHRYMVGWQETAWAEVQRLLGQDPVLVARAFISSGEGMKRERCVEVEPACQYSNCPCDGHWVTCAKPLPCPEHPVTQKPPEQEIAETGVPVCKSCGLESRLDFHVPDAVWCVVVTESLRNKFVCLSCFDAMADGCNQSYAGSIDGLWFSGRNGGFEARLVRYPSETGLRERLTSLEGENAKLRAFRDAAGPDVRKRHIKCLVHPTDGTHCEPCGEYWPCPPIAALDATEGKS
jgi:hypothetical protein